MGSLVRLDTGSIPPHLKPLTMVEEQLLGIGRAKRYVFVLRPNGGDPTLKQFCFKGHMIAFPNVDIEDILSCFPMALSDIPNHMQVSFLQNAY
jgi:hypothetical protein